MPGSRAARRLGSGGLGPAEHHSLGPHPPLRQGAAARDASPLSLGPWGPRPRRASHPRPLPSRLARRPGKRPPHSRRPVRPGDTPCPGPPWPGNASPLSLCPFARRPGTPLPSPPQAFPAQGPTPWQTPAPARLARSPWQTPPPHSLRRRRLPGGDGGFPPGLPGLGACGRGWGRRRGGGMPPAVGAPRGGRARLGAGG